MRFKNSKLTVTVLHLFILLALLSAARVVSASKAYVSPRHYSCRSAISKKIKNPLSNIYSGITVGIVSGNSSNSTTSTIDLATANEQLIVINNNLNEQLYPVFGMNLGYGLAFGSHYYAGLEVFGNLRRENTQGRVVAEQQDVQGIDFIVDNQVVLKSTGIEYGARFRPGYFVGSKTLMYAMIGFIRSRFDLDLITIYNNRAAADSGTSDLIAQQTHSGLQLGIGFEHSFAPHFSLRAEYIYTGYSNLQINGESPIAGAQAGDTVTNSTNINPRNQSIIISFEYHFA